MKKRVLFVFLIFLLIMNFSFILAQNETIQDSAYTCLEDKVDGNCDDLTFEQQVFSLMAIGQCRDEVQDDDDFFMENTKLTAQAILALSRSNVDTSTAEDWILSQSTEPEDMDWLLQIESNDATSCTITRDGSSSFSVTINEDKTLTAGSSSCFNTYGGDHWLRISQDCYGEEFTISCQAAFLTNLIYKKTDENTLYVSGATSTASAGGTTKEQVNSYCFTEEDSCDYEASLWATLVLDYLGNDISSYLPYLITMKDDYPEFIPESFLQSLTGDFRGELLSVPLPISGNRYYDTAVAFLPFQGETIDEKTEAINWLTEVQGSDGCWNGGNVRDTAFVLYSLWPRAIVNLVGCEDSGYHCMSPITCSEAGGETLDNYGGCFGTSICCSALPPLESCADQGGEICGSDEQCTISISQASDTNECCLGSCTSTTQTECELFVDGICRSSCYSNEQEADYDCDSGVCCVEQVAPAKKSYWWIWLLIILIILVIIGIIFKDKLRKVWLNFKNKVIKKAEKGGPVGPLKGPAVPPGAPPLRPGMPPRRPIAPRKILPPSQNKPESKPAPKPKGKSDIDDVLKKLKEMGK